MTNDPETNDLEKKNPEKENLSGLPENSSDFSKNPPEKSPESLHSVNSMNFQNSQNPQNYPGNYPGNHPGNYPGNYPENHPGNYPGNHPGNYPGNHPGNYPGNYPRNYPYYGFYNPSYGKSDNYSGNYPANYPPPYYQHQQYQQSHSYQQSGAFYGDRYAPVYTPPSPPPECPPTPPAEPIVMNRKILIMACVMAGMIFLLCIYCIVSDLLHGALNADPIQNTVILEMQEKPDLNPEDENVTADGEYTVRGVAELVKPSIVEVYVYQDELTRPGSLSGTGSGIIISEDGYIITNAHVVQGIGFIVRLDDEKEYNAVLIGSDSKTDLAVLKINAPDLVPAVLGDSDEVYVGESVVAIGNPAGLVNTVTKGIVSALNRQVRAENNGFMMDCIQTDAAISPGNSGGALVNMYGQVIGITSSKYASVAFEASYEGLGFAITINQALPVIQDLIENGYVSGRFRIGIVFMEADPEQMYIQEEFENQFGTDLPEELEHTLWITEISEDCDISRTALQPNDFIISMNGETITDYDSVLQVLDGC
ncbi:MAG: trypsin-like peptidase domain-containing protein, partial [Oscillospiraceae bacterium]|nr:trypsin-like peptidase domain-containing protein [Oscillospiraceae bacterium]